MRWLKFLLSHSIFVSLCAFALCYQTFLLLHQPIDWNICFVVFWTTLAAYNLYWGISKWNLEKKNRFNISHYFLNLFLIFLSSIAILFYFPIVVSMGIYFIIPVITTILYFSPLLIKNDFSDKYLKIGLLKTILLAFTWSFATVIIPAHSIYLSDQNHVLFIFLLRFLFLLTLCIIFDSRDSKVDLFHGVKSLATELSEKSVHVLMFLIFLTEILLLIFLSKFMIEIRQVFVLMTTAVLSILCYLLSIKKERSYYFYYFFVDGLMLFSSIASYIATI